MQVLVTLTFPFLRNRKAHMSLQEIRRIFLPGQMYFICLFNRIVVALFYAIRIPQLPSMGKAKATPFTAHNKHFRHVYGNNVYPAGFVV